MQRIVLLIALYCTLVIDASAQAYPYWQWGKADTTAAFTITPGYPHHVIAAANKKILWGVMQTPKINVTPASYGVYKMQERDSMGNPIGSSTIFGGKVWFKDAQADAAGNWYVLGAYYDSITYLNNFIQVKTQFNSPDQFMLRLDAGTLNMSWYQHLGVNYYSMSNCFTIKGNYMYIPIDSSLISTVYKVNLTDGSRTAVLWQKAGTITAIAIDSNDNIYIAGSSPQAGDTARFNGYKIYIPNAYATYLVRYHANGQYDWSTWMHDVTIVKRNVVVANNNNICYSGGLYDSMTIGGYYVKKPRSMLTNFIAASFDSTGTLRWARTAVDSAGNAQMDYMYNSVFVDTTFVIMPTAQNIIDWGNGILTNFSLRNLPVLIGYNKTGATAWMKFTDAKTSNAHHITTDGKNIWITGNFHDSFMMAIDTVTITPAAVPAYTPYLAKLRMPPAQNIDSTDTTNAVPVIRNADLSIAPNPATRVVRIAGLTETTDIKLISVTGTVLYERKAVQPSATEYISVADYPRGLYFIELRTAQDRIVKKIVLN